MSALENAMRGGSFSFKALAYAVFSAKGEGVSCALYNSGKCVVQGKGTEQFVAHYLPNHAVALEAPLRLEAEFTQTVIGSDESGKGDYFGPLVTAAVACGPEHAVLLEDVLVTDSKKMSAGAIRQSAAGIRETLDYAIVVINPERYNQLYAKIGNLNKLLAWCHGTAIEEVLEKRDVGMLVVDKFCDERTLLAGFKPKAKTKQLVLRPKAESNPAVGAASILASDAFTRGLEKLGRDNNLKLPKGAGSPVEAAARRLLQSQGREVLSRVAKMHFRTTEKIGG